MEESKDVTDSNVKSTIDAVTGLVKAIPVYQDTLQPAAKQVGQSLETVTKTVNIALAPIKILVWGYEQIEAYISSRVAEKLKNVPKENIITPKPEVAGPAIEALRYSGHLDDLRELYANLIANAMDQLTSHETHPAFVEVIKNLTAEEARILKGFTNNITQFPAIDIKSNMKDGSGYHIIFTNYTHLHKTLAIGHPNHVPTYLNNLCRLGVIEIPFGEYLSDLNIYNTLINDSDLDELKEQILDSNTDFGYERRLIKLTPFGKQFMNRVVRDKQ